MWMGSEVNSALIGGGAGGGGRIDGGGGLGELARVVGWGVASEGGRGLVVEGGGGGGGGGAEGAGT